MYEETAEESLASEPEGATFVCSHCGEEFADAAACPACGRLREPATCETHPERQAEGRCAVCGRAVCERCAGPSTRTYLCEAHCDVRVIEGWAEVYTAPTDIEVQLVRETLQSEGIDARIYSQRDTIFSVDVGELSIVRLLVPVWEYEAAMEAVRAYLDAQEAPTLTCPSCGTAYEPGTLECPTCGAALD